MTSYEYVNELRRIQEELDNDIQDNNLDERGICSIYNILTDMAEMLEIEIDF